MASMDQHGTSLSFTSGFHVSGSSSGSSNNNSFTSDADYKRDEEGGYDLDFVEKSDKHICPVCLYVLREPMQTECGHRFCKTCIHKWLRNSGKRCPVDNLPLEERQLFPDNFAKREILALNVKCPNVSDGCDQIVTLKHLQSHLSGCLHAYTPCPNECANLVKRGELASHLSSQCPRRSVKCSLCQTDVCAEKLEDHEMCCPQAETTCPACEAQLTRAQISQHITMECQRTNVRCQYQLMGCKFEGERHLMQDHETSAMLYHMSLINRALIMVYTVLNITPNPIQSIHRPTSLGINPVEMQAGSGASSFPSYFNPQGDHIHLNMLQQIFQQLNISSEEVASSSAMENLGTNDRVNIVRSQSQPSTPQTTSQSLPPLTQTGRQTGADNTHSNSGGSRTQSESTRSDNVSFVSKASKQLEKEMPLPSGSQDFKSFKCQNDIHDERLALHEHQIEELAQQNEFRDNQIRELKAKVKNLESQLQDCEGRCGNGIYIWKIKNYHKLRREAEKGETTAIHSNSFYSSFYGYKLCIRVNLNGVDAARGTHLSLFIHFMQGEFDDMLDWPFSGRIILTIVDQNPICELRNNISETLMSKPNLAAFQRPLTARNHKGFGYMEFLPLDVIDGSTYVRNDTLIIKAVIIPSS